MPKPPRLDRRRRPWPRLTQLVGLTRARGQWRIRRRRISFSRLSDHDGSDLLRGEVGGRCQSHPGSIDRGVEPRLTQLVGLTRARGQWRIRRRRISISRLSDHDGSDLLRGEVGGRCQSHPGSIDRGVEQRHALSLRHFRLANGVLYPLAGVAEEFGAAHLDLRGPPGWGAGFLFGDIPVFGGRRWSSGDRGDRRCGRCGATGSSTTAPRFNNCAEGGSFSAADRSGQRPIATFGDIRRHRNRLRFA